MKKTIFQLGVLSFAIVFLMLACEPKKPEGLSSSVKEPVAETKDTPPPVGPSYLSVSQLAFKAYLLDPKATIAEVKAMYLTAQSDSYTMALSSAPKSGETMMSIKSIDLCPCPKATSQGLCPCPGDSTMVRMIAPISLEVKLAFDDQKLKATPIKEKMDGNWEAFEWPAKLPEGPHTLTITGKFAGKQSKSYKLPMEVKDAKLFMKWPQ